MCRLDPTKLWSGFEYGCIRASSNIRSSVALSAFSRLSIKRNRGIVTGRGFDLWFARLRNGQHCSKFVVVRCSEAVKSGTDDSKPLRCNCLRNIVESKIFRTSQKAGLLNRCRGQNLYPGFESHLSATAKTPNVYAGFGALLLLFS